MFIENKKCDPKKIIAVGGSYGGYLTCNFINNFIDTYSFYFLLQISSK